MIRVNIARIILLSVLFILPSVLKAEMTDKQVMEYVENATSQGKSQQQIAKELLMRGVTQAQLQRIKKQYDQQKGITKSTGASSQSTTKRGVSSGTNNSKTSGSNSSMSSANQMFILNAGQVPGESSRNIFFYIDQDGDTTYMMLNGQRNASNIYGHDIFSNSEISFEPNVNVATPEDYRLGPGDEVVINIWGNNEDNIRDFISPEGSIIVSNIGPIYLGGMTVKEANRYLKNIFAQKYGDIADSNSDISLVLGDLRTIQIDVMGEVSQPGSYRLSPFSTVFHALYNAGGTTENGTLRDIKVYRNGKEIANADLYEYLFQGKSSGNIRLQEGDVIVVTPYESLVTFGSGVKNPMTYEIKKGETAKDALGYAGGFAGGTFRDQITITRSGSNGMSVLTVDANDFANTPLVDGDMITISPAMTRYGNRVEVKGGVNIPGIYALGEEISTIRDLIQKANGLTEDAFIGRAVLYREAEDLTQTVEALDLAGILSGTSPDITLQNNDFLVIPSVLDLMPKGDFTISGAVSNPGRYPYAEGMTVEDLIVLAGGLLEGASEAKVDISRRIVDSGAMSSESKIAENYSISLKDGLVVDGTPGFQLQPNDIVDVRFSPSFIQQRRVSVEGEVPFEGEYTLGNRTERLSDLVKRAGGVSEYAYVKGASLTRQFTEEEKATMEETMRIARKASTDSITDEMFLTKEYYNVGIDLEAALQNPGGYEDLVLQPGDKLYIPELVNTVKITGEVLYPNSVIYVPGKKLKYYIDQAGGYGNQAYKSKAFVVYMNGQVAKGKNAEIEPGCQIIIPAKEKVDSVANLQKWLAIGSSAVSLGTMAATIASLFRK